MARPHLGSSTWPSSPRLVVDAPGPLFPTGDVGGHLRSGPADGAPRRSATSRPQGRRLCRGPRPAGPSPLGYGPQQLKQLQQRLLYPRRGPCCQHRRRYPFPPLLRRRLLSAIMDLAVDGLITVRAADGSVIELHVTDYTDTWTAVVTSAPASLLACSHASMRWTWSGPSGGPASPPSPTCSAPTPGWPGLTVWLNRHLLRHLPGALCRRPPGCLKAS